MAIYFNCLDFVHKLRSILCLTSLFKCEFLFFCKYYEAFKLFDISKSKIEPVVPIFLIKLYSKNIKQLTDYVS